MTIELATAIIAVIQTLMQIMGTAGSTTTAVDNIISLIQKVLPLLVDFVPTLYTAIKNIVIELKADPATTQAQWAVLDAIDTQLDTANDAAIAAVDPDAPAAPTT